MTYLNEGSLWNIRADFSGTATELAGTNVAGNEGPGSWSTDDQVLLFSSPSGIHAWTQDSNGGRVEVIVEGGAGADRVFAPQFSPDDRWFVYGANDQNRQLFALPFPVGSEGRRTITIDGGRAPDLAASPESMRGSQRSESPALCVALSGRFGRAQDDHHRRGRCADLAASWESTFLQRPKSRGHELPEGWRFDTGHPHSDRSHSRAR